MNRNFLIFAMAAGVAAASAQAPSKPASSTGAAKPATATHSTAASTLPPRIPRVHGIVRTAFSLRYEDIKLGTGAEAEPNKLYKVFYTGYLASDGHKFDSSDDHRRPVLDKDGKPVMGPDGKPKMGDPEPLTFPQGFGRLIPGFDQGFTGMHIGGKRRLFIPWQLAYGARGRPGPDAEHPGIPPKADLIFDVELVDVSDMPMRPGMGLGPGQPGRPMPRVTPNLPQQPNVQLAPRAPGTPTTPPAPGAAPNPGAPAAPATAPAPGAAPASPPQGQSAPATPQPSAPAAPATPPQQPAQPQPQTPPQPQS
jgi:peptidylprolyl isomerase